MRIVRALVSSILLITTPSLLAYPHFTVHPKPAPNDISNVPNLSYDAILNLIDQIESGEPEREFSLEELDKINRFLANAALQGMLPNDVVEESILRNDIEDLLEVKNLNEFAFALPSGKYLSVSAFCQEYGRIIPCRSWISKKWSQTKHFIKKHKKEIIIGAAVVVAVTLSVGLAAGLSGSAIATDSEKDSKPGNENDQPLVEMPTDSTPEDASALRTVIQEQVTTFKETSVNNNLLETPFFENPHDPSFADKVREFGSHLAHQTLHEISELASVIPQLNQEIKNAGSHFLPADFAAPNQNVEIGNPVENYEKLVTSCHEAIDQIFSTDTAGHYSAEAKKFRDDFVIGIIPPPGMFTKISIDTNIFVEAGRGLDRAGFTKAGRSLMKHGYREGSVFPKPLGNPDQINAQGQKILESILNHPEKIIYERPHPDFEKVIEVVVPGKGGARFTVDGEMIGFLEP